MSDVNEDTSIQTHQVMNFRRLLSQLSDKPKSRTRKRKRKTKKMRRSIARKMRNKPTTQMPAKRTRRTKEIQSASKWKNHLLQQTHPQSQRLEDVAKPHLVGAAGLGEFRRLMIDACRTSFNVTSYKGHFIQGIRV